MILVRSSMKWWRSSSGLAPIASTLEIDPGKPTNSCGTPPVARRVERLRAGLRRVVPPLSRSSNALSCLSSGVDAIAERCEPRMPVRNITISPIVLFSARSPSFSSSLVSLAVSNSFGVFGSKLRFSSRNFVLRCRK